MLTSYMHLLYLPNHLKDCVKKHWTVAPLHISNLQLCTSYLLIKLHEYQQLQITAMSFFTGSRWSATVRLPLIYQGFTNYKVKSCLLKLGTSSQGFQSKWQVKLFVNVPAYTLVSTILISQPSAKLLVHISYASAKGNWFFEVSMYAQNLVFWEVDSM
jgi:hypothetical protein